MFDASPCLCRSSPVAWCLLPGGLIGSTKSAAESAEKPSIIFGDAAHHKYLARVIENVPRAMVSEIVIDTNTVLDWLLFGDPAGRAIGDEVLAHRLRWVATPAMLDELHHVLSRPGLERWQAQFEPTRRMTAIHCHLVEPPSLLAPRQLHCNDVDDQKFIDLALARRAGWLLTRDKALLRLAKGAVRHGVRVLKPVDWIRAAATPTS